jgi:hypothetical protein
MYPALRAGVDREQRAAADSVWATVIVGRARVVQRRSDTSVVP